VRIEPYFHLVKGKPKEFAFAKERKKDQGKRKKKKKINKKGERKREKEERNKNREGEDLGEILRYCAGCHCLCTCPYYRPLTPVFTIMSAALASDEVAEDYKNSLEDLTTNDRFQISNLTVIAKENTEHAMAISRVLENHIRTVGDIS
jgi:hypothetical protein